LQTARRSPSISNFPRSSVQVRIRLPRRIHLPRLTLPPC
jgi:hypothetical protein